MDYTNNQLHIIYGDAIFGVNGKDFQYIFSYERGGLESLKVHGKEWLYRVYLLLLFGEQLQITTEAVDLI